MNGFRKSCSPFDRLMELLVIRLSPQAGKSLVIRANGCLCGSIYVAMYKSGFCKYKQTQEGFTYLVVLLTIAIMGAGLALTGTVWHTEVRREKETELLFIGGEFRRAIKQYYQTGGQYPKRLEDLLKDPRQPATVRYLRKIYPDPITGKKDWGFARGPDNGIIAVYSLSDNTPLKTAGFTLADKDFEGKTKYSEWQFVALPATTK